MARKGRRANSDPVLDPTVGTNIGTALAQAQAADRAKAAEAVEAERKAIEAFLTDPKNNEVRELKEDLVGYGENNIRENSDIQEGSSLSFPEGEGKGILLKIASKQESADKIVFRAFFSLDPDVEQSDYGSVATDLALVISQAQDSGLDPEKLFAFTVEIKKDAPAAEPAAEDEEQKLLAKLSPEEKEGAEILRAEVYLSAEEIKNDVRIQKIKLEPARRKGQLTYYFKSGSWQGYRVFFPEEGFKAGQEVEIIIIGLPKDEKNTEADWRLATIEDKQLRERVVNSDFPLIEIAIIRSQIVEILETDSRKRMSARQLTALLKAYDRLGEILDLPREFALPLEPKEAPTRLVEAPKPFDVKALKEKRDRLFAQCRQAIQTSLESASNLAEGNLIELHQGAFIAAQVLELQERGNRLKVKVELVIYNSSGADDPGIFQDLVDFYEERTQLINQGTITEDEVKILDSTDLEFDLHIPFRVPPELVADFTTIETELKYSLNKVKEILGLHDLKFEASKKGADLAAPGQLSGPAFWEAKNFPNGKRPDLRRNHEVVIKGFNPAGSAAYVRPKTEADQRVREAILAGRELPQIIVNFLKLREKLNEEANVSSRRSLEEVLADLKVFNEVRALLGLDAKYDIVVEKAYQPNQVVDNLEIKTDDRGQLSAMAKDGLPIVIDNKDLPRGWTLLNTHYDVFIKKIENDKYIGRLLLSPEELGLADFRVENPDDLTPDQAARRQELDSLLAAESAEDPDQEERTQLAYLSESYEAVINSLKETLIHNLSPREIAPLGEGYAIKLLKLGIIVRIIDTQTEGDTTVHTFELVDSQYFNPDPNSEKFLGGQFVSKLQSINPDLLDQLRITVKVKNNKFVSEEHTDLDRFYFLSFTQARVDDYHQAKTFLEKSSYLYDLQEKKSKLGDKIEKLRQEFIQDGQGDLDDLAAELRPLLAHYRELEEAYQEIIGQDIEQARLMTLELATPQQRQELMAAKSEAEYNSKFAELIRHTWTRWAYEAKKDRQGEVDLDSDQDLDSSALKYILQLAGFDARECRFEPLASGQSKPGYIHYDTSGAAGVEYSGDVTAAHLGAAIDYPALAKALGLTERKVREIYPAAVKTTAPDRAAAVDHHALSAAPNSSSAEILFTVFKELGVITGDTILRGLKDRNLFGREAEGLAPAEALKIVARAIQFVSYADTFSHPKMGDPDWYARSERTLMGLYRLGSLDFVDVLYYFLRNPNGDGTEEIPLSEMADHPFSSKRRTGDSGPKRLFLNRTGPEPKDWMTIKREKIAQSQEQIKVLEERGLIVSTSSDGPMRGMPLVIDFGGHNLAGASEAAYGLRQAGFLQWKPVYDQRQGPREAFVLYANQGDLASSEFLTDRAQVPRGQVAIRFMPEGQKLGFTLRDLLENLGVPKDEIEKVVAQEPIPEEEKPTPEKLARQARDRHRLEQLKPMVVALRQVHDIALRADKDRGSNYERVVNGYLAVLQETHSAETIAYLRTKLAQF